MRRTIRNRRTPQGHVVALNQNGRAAVTPSGHLRVA